MIEHYHFNTIKFNPLRLWINFSVATILINFNSIMETNIVLYAIFGRLAISITLFVVLAIQCYNIVSQYLLTLKEQENIKIKLKR